MAAGNDNFIDPEDIGSNPSTEPAIGELIARRLRRRDALRGLFGAGAAVALGHEDVAVRRHTHGAGTLKVAGVFGDGETRRHL